MQTQSIAEIFEKLEKRPLDASCEALLGLCRSRFAAGMPVLANFLYFANAEMRHLFDSGERTVDDEKYATTLMEGDVIFPDGIALALSYFRYANPEWNPLRILFSYRSMGDGALPNLNGTDLLPELLVRFRKAF
ncbi:MAG: WecB/TagA/CpsF family glycosyltransferase [Patescibacteria group bacterium]|nr:WecB/TagA/CpsF family glycosyltransferase [Patescibacteria group bacterium]